MTTADDRAQALKTATRDHVDYRPPASTADGRGEFIVELLVVVEADSHTDAAALGERAAQAAGKATTPRSAGRARITNVIVSDVRSDADDEPAE